VEVKGHIFLGVAARPYTTVLGSDLPGSAWRDHYGWLLCSEPGLLFLVPATLETYWETGWIWVLDSELPNAGIPPPLLTCFATTASEGLS
jgi:hypothetical protein